MRILLLLLIIFSSCHSTPGIDGSEFLGNWTMSESSPGYSKDRKITIEVAKQDIFFWVKMKVDGIDMFDEFDKVSDSPTETEFLKSSHKYQLSPDRQTLIPLNGMTDFVLFYHSDNETIQNTIGWFRRK